MIYFHKRNEPHTFSRSTLGLPVVVVSAMAGYVEVFGLQQLGE